jgi:hypothetical protein
VLEIAQLFAAALGKKFTYLPTPPALASLAFSPGLVQRFFGMPVQSLEYFHHECRHDTANAVRDLEPMGVRCPPFASYVEKLVSFYREKKAEVRRTAMI